MKSKQFLIIIMLAFVTGCSSQTTKESSSDNNTQVESKNDSGIVSTPARGSKFSKIKLGMSPQHVIDTIGGPTDQKSYRTAKSWLPYYYGNDGFRRELIYKSEGRLTFGGNGKLITITVDTTEDGYE